MKSVVILIAMLLGISSAFAADIVGKVVGVSDGDTITVLDATLTQHKVRLEGIDAPEKAQPFGQRSKENLSKWVFGRQVVVESTKVDKYQRSVGKVIVDGVDANLEQVKAGYAWHYRKYAREQSTSDRASYAAAEDSARAKGRGLWRDPQTMAPWDWRHGGKDAPSAVSIASGCGCDSGAKCTGPKGGVYCVLPTGKKKYH